MTDDELELEQGLRREIQMAGDRAPVPVDLDAVLDASRTALARRDRRRALLAGALATVLVASGVAAGQVLPSAQEPAGPPEQAASQETTTLAAANAPLSGDPDSYQVSARPLGGGAVQLDFRPLGGQLSTVVLPAGQASLQVTTPLCRYCVVSIVRGDVSWLRTVTREQGGGSGSMSEEPVHLPGANITLGVTGEAADGNRPPAGEFVASVKGLLWMTGDGVIHASDGSTVPSATFGSGQGRQSVYWAADYGELGLIDPRGGLSSQLPGARTGPVSGYFEERRAIAGGLLPAGATVLRADWSGAAGSTLQMQDKPGIGVFYLATAERADAASAAPTLQQVVYRDAAGRTRTLR